MKLIDSASNPMRANDKFKVISANPRDGIPGYRLGDLARIHTITMDGVRVSYFCEPLSDYLLPIRAMRHVRKVQK